MPLRASRLVPAFLFVCAALPASAQPPAAQDSTLNHLVHVEGYRTAEPGTLGAVVERGNGPIDMVLVSGFGVGASVFEDFMARNASWYRMFAITLPGFEGSAAPPMPADTTSYGAQTWTNQAVAAVARLVRERGLERPVLVGHFVNGTQVAARVAIEHPDLARALILLAGSPRFEPVQDSPYWPRGLTRDRKIAMVDRFLAPRWFKTVTPWMWTRGNFVATDYSPDSARGRVFADRANQPPLPVLIRWLCEFHASDLAPDMEKLEQPLLMIQPSFSAAVRADSTRNYLQGYFEEPWRGRFEKRARTETLFVGDAGILVMNDQAAAVDRAIAAFLKREVP
jgi:pimeloyl-ACP methyl ester carboxylesterase